MHAYFQMEVCDKVPAIRRSLDRFEEVEITCLSWPASLRWLSARRESYPRHRKVRESGCVRD